MSISLAEANAIYLAGVIDHFGQVGIKNNTVFVRLKTTLLHRLDVILSILGIERRPYGPFDNRGDSKTPQYEIVLVGKELVMLENMVVGRMKVRPYLFQQKRDELRKLRAKLGLLAPSKIARPEEL